MATETQGSQQPAKPKRRWKLIILSTLFLIAFLGIGGYFLYGIVSHQLSFSEGHRAGKIRKFSNKGVIFKTWEGELALEATGVTQEVFYFSVESSNQATIKAIDKAMLDGVRVNAHYEEKYNQVSWLGETKYFIDKIEVKP